MSDNYWTDWQQNKRLSGLEDELTSVSSSLSAARASTARLKSELSKVSGSLEQRLTRLSAAFDAFVEISDLRVTLALFHAHGRVRHQMKRLLAGEPVVDVADAEGYWLAPALVALRGVADGVVDAEALSLAEARDPLRTKAFHALFASSVGGTPQAFGEVVPALSETVSRYERAMWLLAADGFFGPGGWSECGSLLSKLADSSLEDTLRAASSSPTKVEMPRDLDGVADLVTALQAADRLTGLRDWVTSTLDAHTGEREATADPLVRRTLDLLIDEGSPVELPLLVRERELRAVIEGTSAESRTWDGQVGKATDLLREDLVAERKGRRALALRASAAVVLSVAEKFEAATRTQPPATVTYRSRYGQVTITPTEADGTSLQKAEDMVGQVSRPESRGRQAAIGAGVVAVLFVVLAVVAGWGWVFVALGAVGVGVYQLMTDARLRREAAEHAVTQRERLRADVAERVELFASTRRELHDRQARVTDDMAALRAALATVAE